MTTKTPETPASDAAPTEATAATHHQGPTNLVRAAGTMDLAKNAPGENLAAPIAPATHPYLSIDSHWDPSPGVPTTSDSPANAVRDPKAGIDARTDLGNAERLVRKFGSWIRYCNELGGWLVYRKKRWQRDTTGLIERLAKWVVRGILREANTKRLKVLRAWAYKSQEAARLGAMVRLARTEKGVAVPVEVFDADPWLFNVLNGTLDLRSGKLGPHDPKDHITMIAPVEFDPVASAPKWETFLIETFQGDRELINYMGRLVGLSLVGEVIEHVLPFLFGVGSNGKSVYLGTLQRLFGDYARQVPSSLLLRQGRDVHPEGIARLRGTRLVVTSEPDEGQRLDEANIKALTGGDRVVARFMYKGSFEFDPSWMIWFAANHKPEIRGTDDGIWRRLKQIVFGNRIPENQQNKKLQKELMEELPGILNWALAGLVEYLARGLCTPDSVTAATAEYRREEDVLLAFFAECTEDHGPSIIPSKQLYRAYADWCYESDAPRLTKAKFGRMLTAQGYERRKSNGVIVYRGLRLILEMVQP